MIKKLVIVFIAFFALQLQAQEGTASPYSFYGIGSLKFKGTVENRSMGGLSIYIDSVHVNLQNPAGYAGNNLKAFNNETRPVRFTVGGNYNAVNLKTGSGTGETSTTTFDYLALTIPAGKFGFGFGLLPYSSVGYRLDATDGADVLQARYRGEGGLNKVFAGLGYQITKDLSVGIDAGYNFGSIQNTSIAFLYDEGEVTQYHTRETNRSDLSGLSFNIGVSYKTMLNKKLQLVSGFTYAPESNIKSNNKRSYSAIAFDPFSGQELVFNTIVAELGSLESTNLTLPSKVSFGAGIGQPEKWFVGAESTFQSYSRFDNPIVSIQNAKFVDATAFSFGGFYIPDYNSFSSYWKRVTYRAGFRFENTGIEINNQTINEVGVSLGLGLPVGMVFSSANIGFEIGKRGTTRANLVQENFVNLQLSLSLNDRWFQKRKYY